MMMMMIGKKKIRRKDEKFIFDFEIDSHQLQKPQIQQIQVVIIIAEDDEDDDIIINIVENE